MTQETVAAGGPLADGDTLDVSEIVRKRAELKAMLEASKRPMAVMFTDIEGSTRIFEQFGDIHGRETIEAQNLMLFPIIQTYGGKVVKTIGDAIMAYFETAEQSVRASIGMQNALLNHNRQNAEELSQIHIRIGVHFGTGLRKRQDHRCLR